MWVETPSDVRGVESERAEFQCRAEGSPQPGYTWVDWEGRDATEKEGEVNSEEEEEDVEAEMIHPYQVGSWMRYRVL